ncbi:hypothetical protein [Methylocaldum szegediense]|uniref:Uncharacterized protein n=1 Tax=Methylocaldum szegediense TaxID=73780 RepID=A0ABM9I249_9GAMM|nr:hypothetical protein [Methylocaldum szegediense]CAI8838846.1 conserved protein of unknown function [Methylocaldum szegediense]
MRKEYGKALRDRFDREMKARLPTFKPFKSKSIYLFPGERVYHRILENPIHCFIILVPSRKDTDEFTIEIGWSKPGRFPELGMRPSGRPTPERTEFEQAELVCRLSDFWTREDVWWPVGAVAKLDVLNPKDQMEALMARVKPISPDEANEAVQGPVEESIDRIIAHAVPYLDEFARFQEAA